MAIPQSACFYNLDEVKNIPILDVCDYLGIPVQKRGRNYWCKVRPEQTASAVLHPDRNTFHDFGSNVSGSNIDLVCQVTGKSISESVRMLGAAFGLSRETRAETRCRFRIMSRTDYARIGLHSDLATKNFTFPVAERTPDVLLKIEQRYQISMNELRKRHPNIYARILREKAIPYTERLRNLYYLDVWNHHNFLQSIGKQAYFYDSERTRNYFSAQRKAMEQMEFSLAKAVLGTDIELAPAPKYDPMRVISLFLQEKLSISVGNQLPDEFASEANHNGVKPVELILPYEVFFQEEIGAVLGSIPHAALLNRNHVRLSCYEKDVSRLASFISVKTTHQTSSLDSLIQSAADRAGTPGHEPAHHRAPEFNHC